MTKNNGLGGLLDYYSLIGWWKEIFTRSEQLYIEQKYRPLNLTTLTSDRVSNSSITVINFLTGIQSWFTNLSDESISERILKKAENLLLEETSVLIYSQTYELHDSIEHPAICPAHAGLISKNSSNLFE